MSKIMKIMATSLLVYSLYVLISLFGYSFIKMNVQNKSILDEEIVSLDEFTSSEPNLTETVALHSTVEGALQLRLDLIRSAKEELYISQYSIGHDKSGLMFVNEIKEAAQRGVKVKLLVNRFSNSVSKNSYLSVLDEFENVEIKVVGGINLLQPWKMNNVIHDKLIIVDNEYLLSSGRNVNDRFQVPSTKEAVVNDLDIIVQNGKHEKSPKIINEGKAYYNELWAADYAKNKKKYPNSRWLTTSSDFSNEVNQTTKELKDDIGQPVLSNLDFYPMDRAFFSYNSTNEWVKKPIVWAQMTAFMNQGTGKFKLISPYVVLTNPMQDYIKANNNTQLEIYTNSMSNSPNVLAFSGYLFQKNKLLEKADIWELQAENSNHQKAFLMEEGIVGVGSMNSDSRSAYFSSENMLIVQSEGLAKELQAVITRYENQSLKATGRTSYEENSSVTEKPVNLFKKILVNLLSVFSPFFRFLL